MENLKESNNMAGPGADGADGAEGSDKDFDPNITVINHHRKLLLSRIYILSCILPNFNVHSSYLVKKIEIQVRKNLAQTC